MIEVKNLTVKYDKQIVLNKINLSFPNKGLIAIVGPSGCGKTTLFNCLSSLIDYEGEILYDGKNIKLLPLTRIDKFRLRNIGFIFQDFKLFNLDTVRNNVAFPFKINSGYSSFRNEQRINDLLVLVDLDEKAKQVVKTLSGGEKQRVAIARALVNNPKYVLADEPTGALDEKNAERVMNILKTISRDKLMIIVSHDRELIDKYADQIVEMEDGKIKAICNKNNIFEGKNINLVNKDYSRKNPEIPLSFLINHTMNSIKERKWRNLLTTLVTSLGLIGVGLAFSLSTSISVNIKKACSNLVSENQIIVTNKEEEKIVTLKSKDYIDAVNVKQRYLPYVKDIGVIYQTNFNSFFKDTNEVYAYSNKTKISINGYSAIQFNEYSWLDDVDSKIFPSRPKELANDEVVASLSLGMINSICFQLAITRNIETFIDYMKENDIYLILHVKNDEWGYEDERLFKLKGFIIDYELKLYHYNHLWNEQIFEKDMKLPSSLNLSSKDYYPWTLKKIHYLEMNNETDRDNFIVETRNDHNTIGTLFEIANHSYFPFTYDTNYETRHIKKVLLFDNSTSYIPLERVSQIQNEVSTLSNPLVGMANGYSIYKDALMSGFSNYAYFSLDKDKLETLLEEYASLQTLGNQTMNLPPGIEVGHYSKSLQKGVIFQQIPDILLEKHQKLSLDEVVLSTALYKDLGMNSDELIFAYTYQDERLQNGTYIRDFKINKLKIIDLVESDKKVIYQNTSWVMDYFQTRIGISSFLLGINAISFSVNDSNDIDEAILKVKRAFPSYEAVNPLHSINEGIDEICSYLEIALLAFSFIATLISTFLLSMCNYLHALEIKKDIGLARCIGVSKYESTKFIFTHSYTMSFFSLVISILELTVSNYFISRFLASYLEVDFSFSFNPTSIVFMFLLSLVISTLSSLIISLRVIKFSPIESLKEV